MKDWLGNSKSTYSCLGASNHTEKERQEHDFYATEPIAGECLLKLLPELDNIWENAVGQGHLAEVFRKINKLSKISDLIDRNYYPENIETIYGDNFLDMEEKWKGDIITNPPYKIAESFVRQSLKLIEKDRYVCMFLRLQFLEGKARKKLFTEYPPKYVFVASGRIDCAMNGDFEKNKNGAVAYGWFIWQKDYQGETIIKWFN